MVRLRCPFRFHHCSNIFKSLECNNNTWYVMWIKWYVILFEAVYCPFNSNSIAVTVRTVLKKRFAIFMFDSQKFTKLPIEGCKIGYVMNSVTLFIESIQFKDSGSGFKGWKGFLHFSAYIERVKHIWQRIFE